MTPGHWIAGIIGLSLIVLVVDRTFDGIIWDASCLSCAVYHFVFLGALVLVGLVVLLLLGVDVAAIARAVAGAGGGR